MSPEIRELLKYELSCEDSVIDEQKDIIVIVHNQLEYVKKCIESVQQHTKNYQLWVWDNNSTDGTREYLQSLKDIQLYCADNNYGFINPNNSIVKNCKSNYFILLNSDTEVMEGWDRAMLGYLQNNPEVAQVGCMGGLLNSEGRGCNVVSCGEQIDYVMGWCFCIPKQTYEKFGLFDEHYKIAYFEDSDLSLRIKKAGLGVYALHLNYVRHFGSITARTLQAGLQKCFNENWEKFTTRWGEYLESYRILSR